MSKEKNCHGQLLSTLHVIGMEAELTHRECLPLLRSRRAAGSISPPMATATTAGLPGSSVTPGAASRYVIAAGFLAHRLAAVDFSASVTTPCPGQCAELPITDLQLQST